jgi:hypothetical protein
MTRLPFVYVPCSVRGCEIELRVIPEHRDNVAPTWRCLEHRTQERTA